MPCKIYVKTVAETRLVSPVTVGGRQGAALTESQFRSEAVEIGTRHAYSHEFQIHEQLVLVVD